MKCYKFMDSNDVVHLAENHTIRISKLSRFRLLYGSEWIADPWEGVTTTRVCADLRGKEDQPLLRSRLMTEARIVTSVKSKVKIDSTLVFWAPDDFVFCVSMPPYESAETAMCDRPETSERYNACVEFGSISWLIEDVIETGFVQELGISLRQAFGTYEIGPVIYGDPNRRFPEQNIVERDPFFKRSIFCGQQEYRIVFPQRVHFPEVLTVKFHPRPGLLRVKLRAEPAPPKVMPVVDRVKAGSLFEAAAAFIRRIQQTESTPERSSLWEDYKTTYAKEVRVVYRVLRASGHGTKMLDFHFGRFFSQHDEQYLASEFDAIADGLRQGCP